MAFGTPLGPFLARSDAAFESVRHPLPGHLSRELLRNQRVSTEELLHLVGSVRPVMLQSVQTHVGRFLDCKRSTGSAVERALYERMDEDQLISRLFLKRCAMFCGREDDWILRDGSSGRGGFECVGSDDEQAPLLLRDVLSYDEMAVGALLGLSSYSRFFNDGKRHNMGQDATPGTFVERGVVVGLVGTRFERPQVMDSRHMLVSRTQNTVGNGYGAASATQSALLGTWARFYGVPHLPLFEEACRDTAGQRFERVSDDEYLDKAVYCARVRVLALTLLLEAERRAREAGRKAYVHVVGLGLGVWRVHNVQRELYLSTFVAVAETRASTTEIADIDFSYIGDCAESRVLPNGIRVHRSRRDPQQRLGDGGGGDGPLLVVSYAWDSNAWPGNEFYSGSLGGSGDPAAAACSMISELHNADINRNVNGARVCLREDD